ncbi:Glucose-6-phosphate 1-dehydrogenase 1, chloroplastic [Balamuthia mandrillaris]
MEGRARSRASSQEQQPQEAQQSLRELQRENQHLREALQEYEDKLLQMEAQSHSLFCRQTEAAGGTLLDQDCCAPPHSSSEEAASSSSPSSTTSIRGSNSGLKKSVGEDVAAKALTIVVLGASGDLARKKTFPALFHLYLDGLLPPAVQIAGFARSKMSEKDFNAKISEHFEKGAPEEKKTEFLKHCYYQQGLYDSGDSWKEFDKVMKEREKQYGHGEHGANRIFYMAIPPSIFEDTARALRPNAMSKTGWNRIVVEKPFGRDTKSAAELEAVLGELFAEDQLYRIDHYLGKEMVQNLMVLRFANEVFEPVWNRNHIASVQITFKEPFGTEGRGGYFDEFGIIRDVMQNHLLQMLSLVAMEPPVTLHAEDVRDEKAKLLRAIPPLRREDLVVGQYEGYLDDETVPKDSRTPTFAAAVLHVKNSRWNGTPFILKCGKAINERKAEVRIQFKRPSNNLFRNLSPNELVLKVQPDTAVYLKMTSKKPGLSTETVYTELDLSYGERFEGTRLPDAYERLILDVVRGDHNLFVRHDELMSAWAIFTPVLHELEQNEEERPYTYPFGSRGPPEADDLVRRYGYERPENYTWIKKKSNV